MLIWKSIKNLILNENSRIILFIGLRCKSVNICLGGMLPFQSWIPPLVGVGTALDEAAQRTAATLVHFIFMTKKLK